MGTSSPSNASTLPGFLASPCCLQSINLSAFGEITECMLGHTVNIQPGSLQLYLSLHFLLTQPMGQSEVSP